MQGQGITGSKMGATGEPMETAVFCWRFVVRESSVLEDKLPAVTSIQSEIINSSTEVCKRLQLNEI
jgi:hypothetical protein